LERARISPVLLGLPLIPPAKCSHFGSERRGVPNRVPLFHHQSVVFEELPADHRDATERLSLRASRAGDPKPCRSAISDSPSVQGAARRVQRRRVTVPLSVPRWLVVTRGSGSSAACVGTRTRAANDLTSAGCGPPTISPPRSHRPFHMLLPRSPRPVHLMEEGSHLFD
jgi:hypothetical protein